MIESEKDYRQHLIDKIKQIDDKRIIEEIYRLLEIDFEDTVYETNEDQRNAIAEAQQQIDSGQTISEKDANREIDEWLEK